ncbi:hypothetical protein SAY86_022506 [Trapa natans]|uniref:Fe2OG dioxygenase domain-containing protein n=1 Tax=Trapa natans TaxID=22666 RepID=A0AAN7LT45_TRANT|nr:hypothetical protein SAY86_022506 [Trapa natans]
MSSTLACLGKMASSSLPPGFPPFKDALKTPVFLNHSASAHSDQDHHSIPTQFLWPEECTTRALGELNEPLVDLEGFLCGDRDSIIEAARAVREACIRHGFFQVVNHGIDPELIQAAHDWIDPFFRAPMETKLRARTQVGSMWGYSSSHSERFSWRLPWKETLSFGFPESSQESVVKYFESTLGEDFVQTGMVYEKYCEAMKDLSLKMMELLAISLGVDRLYYRDFFKESRSIMRCNSYPPCRDPSRVLGTGPHCDPTSLTILHQDQVGGLEVLSDGEWQKVRPDRPDALVINIGDTFMALSNGKYKSCMHRVVVNKREVRRSLSFFFCPSPDKPVRPPPSLLANDQSGRKYPDFSWSEFLHFLGKHRRADSGDTLDRFSDWILSRSPSSPPSPDQEPTLTASVRALTLGDQLMNQHVH